MGITVDNTIIDFNTINNIVNTLNTHQDVFTAFEQETLLQTYDNTNVAGPSGVIQNSLNVTSVQMASVRVQGFIGDNPIAFNAPFSAPPVVLVSIENSGSIPLIATIKDSSSSSTTTSATSTYTGAIINVSSTTSATTSPAFFIHLLAIGQR